MNVTTHAHSVAVLVGRVEPLQRRLQLVRRPSVDRLGRRSSSSSSIAVAISLRLRLTVTVSSGTAATTTPATIIVITSTSSVLARGGTTAFAVGLLSPVVPAGRLAISGTCTSTSTGTGMSTSSCTDGPTRLAAAAFPTLLLLLSPLLRGEGNLHERGHVHHHV